MFFWINKFIKSINNISLTNFNSTNFNHLISTSSIKSRCFCIKYYISRLHKWKITRPNNNIDSIINYGKFSTIKPFKMIFRIINFFVVRRYNPISYRECLTTTMVSNSNSSISHFNSFTYKFTSMFT